MEINKPKKKHHYIPVFYLKGFTDNSGAIWVYDKNEKGMFASSPEGVAFEKHYFSITTNDGQTDSETGENLIASLETEFSKVLRKIQANKSLTEDERITYCWFVASMMVRTPNFRNNIQKATSEMMTYMNVFMASHKTNFEHMIKRYEKNTGKEIGMPVEELRQWMVNPKNYTLTVDPQYAIGMALAQMEDLTKIFINMNWIFLKAPEDCKFLTGDNPLSYMDPTYIEKSFYRGVGLVNKAIEVTLPISKDICALGGWNSRIKEGFLQIKKQMVKNLNRRTVIASRRFVFTDYKSEQTDAFVKKYKGSHRVMVVGTPL